MSEPQEIHNFSNLNIENLENELQKNVEIFRNEISEISNSTKIINDIHEEIDKKKKNYNALKKTSNAVSVEILKTEKQIEFYKKNLEKRQIHISHMEEALDVTVEELAKATEIKNAIHADLVKKNNSLKLATKYYKQNLDFYVKMKILDDVYSATICFFTQEYNDTYSFVMKQKMDDEKWKLESTKPELPASQFLALQKRFDEKNHLPVLVATFRKIFLLMK